jgi:hypothetical protein
MTHDPAIIEAAARALAECGFYDNEAVAAAKTMLAAATPLIEAKALEEASEALMDQWLSNHAEHCGKRGPPWPHNGMCHWPMPEILIRLRALKEQPYDIKKAIPAIDPLTGIEE